LDKSGGRRFLADVSLHELELLRVLRLAVEECRRNRAAQENADDTIDAGLKERSRSRQSDP
jgi:hypothetical protein